MPFARFYLPFFPISQGWRKQGATLVRETGVARATLKNGRKQMAIAIIGAVAGLLSTMVDGVAEHLKEQTGTQEGGHGESHAACQVRPGV